MCFWFYCCVYWRSFGNRQIIMYNMNPITLISLHQINFRQQSTNENRPVSFLFLFHGFHYFNTFSDHIRVPCVAYLNLIHCHQWLCVNMHINANTALGKSFKWSKVTGKAYYFLISHNQKHLYHLFLFYMTLCCSRLDIFISFI